MSLPADAFKLAGVTLTTEERATLSNSLVLLRESQKFTSADLWGVIQGVQKDYYIARCKTEESLLDGKFFYSQDAITWVQLPNPTDKDRQRAAELQSKFTGDPAFETIPHEEGDESGMNEEKRLAAVVSQITQDAEVVPRGAYYRDATESLQINPSFQGIPKAQLGQLSSYMHFRRGLDLNGKNMIEREHLDEAIDIFETISEDKPQGAWSVQTYHGRPGFGSGSTVLLRSLLWPGYLSYHSVSANASCQAEYGNVYRGLGIQNVNIGFMV